MLRLNPVLHLSVFQEEALAGTDLSYGPSLLTQNMLKLSGKTDGQSDLCLLFRTR